MLTAIIGSAGFIVLSDMVVDIDDVIVLTANCRVLPFLYMKR